MSDDYDKKWVDEASPDSVLGQWEASDENTFTIDVWKDENGLYHAVINRKKQADTVAFWEMSSKGVASDGETLEYFDGVYSITSYDSKGSETTDIKYSDGEGSIYLKDGCLYWDDKQNNEGENKIFNYVGEY